MLQTFVQKVWPLLMANTVFWDESGRLVQNNDTLQALRQVASLHRLELGGEMVGIVAALDGL